MVRRELPNRGLGAGKIRTVGRFALKRSRAVKRQLNPRAPMWQSVTRSYKWLHSATLIVTSRARFCFAVAEIGVYSRLTRLIFSFTVSEYSIQPNVPEIRPGREVLPKNPLSRQRG